MNLLAALLIIPHVWAWTPPIFLDTMKLEPPKLRKKSHRKLQMVGGPAPTSSPTESPAPSPSPSAFPTGGPTVTAKPTGTPTASPTESPAPSPSPSAFPTASPTTGTPTSSPTGSLAPTDHPTASRAPSPAPTTSPSAAPSVVPTTQPSSSPTYIREIQASFVVDFELDQRLGKFETDAFEVATKRWMSYFPLGEGSIEDITVDLFNQVIKTEPTTGDGNGDIKKYLQIFFLVHVEYTGTNTDFDLFAVFDPQFQSLNSVWLYELGQEDTAFSYLGTNPQNGLNQEIGRSQKTAEDKRKSISKRSYTGILLVSFFALILALIASVYAIRSHNLSTFGTELRSPSSKGLSVHVNSFTSQGVEAKVTAAESDLSSKPSKSNHQKSLQGNQKQIPPNKDAGREKAASPKEQVGRRSSLQAPPPPPRRPSEESSNAQSMKERDPVAKRVSELHEPPAFSEVNFGRSSSLFDRVRTSTSAVFRHDGRIVEKELLNSHKCSPRRVMQQSLSSEATEESGSMAPGRISGTMAERIAKFERTSDASDGGQELLLTKSYGGTLGAKSVSNPGTSSDVSSQAKAFFDNLVKKTSEQLNGIAPAKRGEQPQQVPPTQPMSTGNQHIKQGTSNRRDSYDSVLRKPGLYDVLAPPGPIGIVVDTTTNGPAVHSLKNTSPMMGLIAPGDLIVGLDDADTRGMTAATLTRLMAQKANQKERKITLLTVDGY